MGLSAFAQQGLYVLLHFISFRTKSGADAEECYSQIINGLKQSFNSNDPTKGLIESHFMGEIQRT